MTLSPARQTGGSAVETSLGRDALRCVPSAARGLRALPHLLTASAFALVPGCSASIPQPELHRYQDSSPHMGTLFTLTLYAESKSKAEEAAQAAFHRVARLEDVLSDYMADSELVKLTDAPTAKPLRVSEDLFCVLQRGMEISTLTDGAFDLTAGPFTRLWRFSRKRGRLPSDSDLAEARAAVGWNKMLLNPKTRTVTLTAERMRLDAGGIAKGYAADEAMKVLKAHGIDRALVAAGGDLVASLPPPGAEGWRVAIAGTGPTRQAPQASRSTSGAAGIAGGSTTSPRMLLLRNAAVSTSGDAEQFVEIDGARYSHIVNPVTGLGLTHSIQATVIAPDATTSDALATACCILGPDRAVRLADSLPRIAVLLVTTEDGQRRISKSKGAP